MEAFSQAIMDWDLDCLYRDLAYIKQNPLTEWERTCIRGLLSDHNPKAIASEIFWTASALRTELSRRLYPYISQLVDEEKIAWNKISKLLAEAGYKYPSLKVLKKDLLNLDFISNNSHDRNIPKASIIITSLEERLKTKIKLNTSSDLEVTTIIKKGDESSKQKDFSKAISFYQEALIINPHMIGVLIKIARCYDKLKSYKNSLFICDFALARLEETKDQSFREKNEHKSQIYNFLAGVFQELVEQKLDEKYIFSAYLFYQKAVFFCPCDLVPTWNMVDFFIQVFKKYPANTEEYKYYDELAKSSLFKYKITLKNAKHDLNLSSYKKILNDYQRAFEGLDDWWQQQLEELKSL